MKAWFVREVLPLEATLVQFLRKASRNESDVEDLRQEVYMRLFETAKKNCQSPPGRSSSASPAIS